MRAILLGLLSSAFFSATFIINRAMNVSGTSWAWTASFRFLFALPILFLIVLFRKNLRELWEELKKHPLAWIGWGFCCWYWFLFFIKFCSCLFSSLARCWNLASYDISRFTTITTIFR
nr:multidrug resistance efflux transporter family protein [Bacillus anthracis]